ncbi:MAG: XRE family transcriptional regulator [Deltaproteobacteria bacterium]|nr:XRE family transcriptional regulator [Deltaproteobacteria bacterium]
MKSRTKNLGVDLSISPTRVKLAYIKAELIRAVLRIVKKEKLTHQELAKRSKLSRSTVTGILSGSLQKVTLDRLIRLVEAVGLEADIRIKKAA